MINEWVRRVCAAGVVAALAAAVPTSAQEQPVARFGAHVSYVSIAAVVRDRHGRTVRSLSPADFLVRDGGVPRQIADVWTEDSAPASVALLIDGSGSMRLGDADQTARSISRAILKRLTPGRDEAALFSFDRRLLTLQEFTHDLDGVRRRLADVESWGTTSLFDAIGGTAGIVARKTRNRRAVVVFTDGIDNASAYTADEVAAVASSIDVPIYVFGLGAGPESAAAQAPLAELARLTGGAYFPAGTDALVNAGIDALVDELRHQYVLAFEPSPGGGWRGVEVVTRDKSLRVRTRHYYFAGNAE
jgi:VWFA-related protein